MLEQTSHFEKLHVQGQTYEINLMKHTNIVIA